jgi:hypothetical protein
MATPKGVQPTRVSPNTNMLSLRDKVHGVTFVNSCVALSCRAKVHGVTFGEIGSMLVIACLLVSATEQSHSAKWILCYQKID